jgi:hypothetical protein
MSWSRRFDAPIALPTANKFAAGTVTQRIARTSRRLLAPLDNAQRIDQRGESRP